MSRSYKKAIIKDRPRNYKKSTAYWRKIRSSINNKVRQMKYNPDIELEDPKSIVNDYDYSDYTFRYDTTEPINHLNCNRNDWEEDKIKARRK